MKYEKVEYIKPGTIMCRNPNRRLDGWIDSLERDMSDPEWANEALYLIRRMKEELDARRHD